MALFASADTVAVEHQDGMTFSYGILRSPSYEATEWRVEFDDHAVMVPHERIREDERDCDEDYEDSLRNAPADLTPVA